jgi:uncharacterized protein (TIGR03790 family)
MKMRPRILLISLIALQACLPVRAIDTGAQVIVVYNSAMPESRQVAEHYAAHRAVPNEQVFGLDLPKSETMSRAEFENDLERPLYKKLESTGLWKLRPASRPAEKGKTQPVEIVGESKIKYAVLCYGVPVKIDAVAGLNDAPADLIPVLRRNEAAVDSELALLPMFGSKRPITGVFVNPSFAVTNVSTLQPTNGLLLVARLDGPSSAIAMRLVDKAMEAETNGLWGRAYFDARGLTNGPFKLGDDWIRTAASVVRRYGYETILDDQPSTFGVNYPLSQVALYAGWYDGNVSGPFTKETVEFMPGAIAYHLHSFNATTIRTASEHWVGPLLAKGVTATMGSVNEPFLQGTPDLAVFFSRLFFNGFTFGEAAYACQAWLSWQNTIIGDPLYHPAVRNPEKLHDLLTAEKSKLVEWSHIRVVNLNLQTGLPPQQCIDFLEQLPEAKTSAVLQEKLGDLYTGLAKLNDSFQPYEKALKLNPSPQQETRIALKVAPLLASFGRTAEAYEVYQKFLKDVPAYSDMLPIYEKVAALAESLGKTAEAEKYHQEINRLRPGTKSGE